MGMPTSKFGGGNQFKNVTYQCTKVAMVPKTVEAGAHFCIQVMICLLKEQLVTMKLGTGILYVGSRSVPRRLAMLQETMSHKHFSDSMMKLRWSSTRKSMPLKSFGDKAKFMSCWGCGEKDTRELFVILFLPAAEA